MGIIASKQRQQHASLLAPSMEGNLAEVKRLVGISIADNNNNGNGNSSAHVNATDAAGNAAIHGAVFSGHVDVLAFLVEDCGADPTLKNGLGCSPLWIAAGYDRLECLRYLVDKLSGDESSNSNNESKLEMALLGEEDGANSSGDTPFLAAASKGNVKACECLLESLERCFPSNDDDDEKRLEMRKAKMLRTANKAGDTPLKVAVASSQGEDMLSFLLRTDDAISIIPSNQSKKDDKVEEDDNDNWMSQTCVNRKNQLGLSPLIVACERNLPKVAALLLRHGADARILDPKGRNVLSIAAFCGCNDTLEFLLHHHHLETDQRQQQTPSSSSPAAAAISSLLNERDSNGCTPAWLAARTGNLSILELLLDAGADATIADEEGSTPYEVAIEFKKEKVMEYFSSKSLQMENDS